MTREQSVTPNSSKESEPRQRLCFPKSHRLLRRADFLQVYQDGVRLSGPYFTAFYLASRESREIRVGFTVPRAIGNAVIRNRIKRRMREAVRLLIRRSGPAWWIVFNPRRSALRASFPALLKEVEKVFERCTSQNAS